MEGISFWGTRPIVDPRRCPAGRCPWVQPSNSRMRAALWALLAVSAVQAGHESVRFVDSRSSPYVLSLSGGGNTTPGEGQEDRNIKAAQPVSSSEPRSRTAAAWSVPWLSRRRRRARSKEVDSPRERMAVPAANPAGKMTPEAAFSSALASFVGAMIVSGGTLGMWPQSVAASPFDPRPPPKSERRPFFEGWFIRLVDHEQRLSFAVIFGSFRTRGESELDQHYVSLSYLHEPKGGILPAEVEEEDPDGAAGAAGGSYEGGDEGGADANAASPQSRPSEIAKRFSRWIREQRLAVLRGVGTEGAGQRFGDPKGFRQKEAGVSADEGFGAPKGVPDKEAGVGGGEERDREKDPTAAGDGGLDANSNEEVTRGLSDGGVVEGEPGVDDAAAGGEGDNGQGREESEGGDKAEVEVDDEGPPATVREGGDNSGEKDGDIGGYNGSGGGVAGDRAGSRLEQGGPVFAGEEGDSDTWGHEGGEARRLAEEGDIEREEDSCIEGKGGGDADAVREPQPVTRPPGWVESEGGESGTGTGTPGGGEAAPESAGGGSGGSGGGGGGGDSGILTGGLAEGGGGGRLGRSGNQDTRNGGFVEQPALLSSPAQQPAMQPAKDQRTVKTSRPTEKEEEEEEEENAERTWTYHAFPPAETVTISRRGEPVDTLPDLVDDPNFTWEADGIGSFTVDGDTGRLSFQLPELSVAASFRRRLPWSEERPNAAGPEGWLQKTGLLPLHYFVHSMGSEAGYSLKATDAPRAVVGRGSMHMEANYGESFPTGWVWAQGCSATEGLYGNVFQDGEPTDGGSGYSADMKGDSGTGIGDEGDEESMETPARFVLTGGRFIIGPVTTNSFVIAFRSKGHNWNFRSTDLDRIAVKASRAENRLKLVARSWGGSRVLEADIHAPAGSFGSAIYVPTPDGFSDAPGCVESYAATATFRLYTKGDKAEGDGVTRPLILREEVEFKLAALEFGGGFQDT